MLPLAFSLSQRWQGALIALGVMSLTIVVVVGLLLLIVLCSKKPAEQSFQDMV
jgi:hypothetical protein